MKEYTAKEMKLLKANPYTFKVTKNKLYFTSEFKEEFWIGYQAGNTQESCWRTWDIIWRYLGRNR